MHRGGSQPAGASRGGNRVGRVAVWKPGAVGDSWPADGQLSAVSRREIVNCSVGPPAAPCVLRPLSAAPSLAVPRAPAAPTNECNVRGCLSPCFARDWGPPRGTLHRALDAACTCTHSPRTRSLARSAPPAAGCPAGCRLGLSRRGWPLRRLGSSRRSCSCSGGYGGCSRFALLRRAGARLHCKARQVAQRTHAVIRDLVSGADWRQIGRL